MAEGERSTRDGGPGGESAIERAVGVLLTESHLARADEVPALARRHVTAFGGVDVVCYLADLQQTVLVPFSGSAGLPYPPPEPLAIETTLAGRAYQRLEILTHEDPDATIAWVPLLDGTERVGVLAVTLADAHVAAAAAGALARRLRVFASLLAELIVTKAAYGDTVLRSRRVTDMTLAAEMQHSLLPPLTFACDAVTVAAALEPAYQVAGDTVDYAVDHEYAHVAVFDSMGHGLRSAQLATVAVAAYRHARRARQPLLETLRQIDDVLVETFGGASFTTAVLAELDTRSGTFRWVNAGHPEPLLIRRGQMIKRLGVRPRTPLGMQLAGGSDSARTATVGVEQLEPGDLVLLYTDGVTEARSPGGEFFGEQRLADLIVRCLASGFPAPETMRRVVRALLEHQHDHLDDDATLLLLQWPSDTRSLLLG